MALDRSKIAIPELPKRVVQCDALGGEVIVQGATMSARIKLERSARKDSARWIAEVLAITVVDDRGTPIMSADEWDTFAGVMPDPASDLYEVAADVLALKADDVEKK